ncbi:MAG TPA: helix-hairpin-helix domain-containing protein [Rhodanobacteraceae bacterium]|nr:helix-hairpin-helix domain-containing protein [Rhodanobacteraceae bacterium]
MNRMLTGLALSLAFALPAIAGTPVDINHADAQTIAKSLDGVGLVKAKAIVAYRKQHGPFHSPEQLAQVKGIGEHTVTANKDDIRIGSVKQAPRRK